MSARAPMPRTLIVDLSLQYGGSSARVLSQMAKMPQGRVALAGLTGSAITLRAQDLELPVYSVGFHKADFRIVGWLTRVIRQGNFQVLDTQNVQSKLWGSIASARTDIALVSTINSWYMAEHGGNLKGRVYQAIELLTNPNLDLYITVSGDERRHLLAAGVAQDKIVMIPNAVEIDPDEIPDNRAGQFNHLGIPEGALVCCAVGRLVWAKGYDDLIEAFASVADRFPNIYCLILGEGSLRPALENYIARKGLQGRIYLIGFRNPVETLSILKGSDIFLMPSRSEATPVALLEAAAIGLPILASSVGGIPELVKDGEHALLVPPGNPRKLAKGIERLIEDPELAARLGSQAQIRVRQEYSLRSQVAATVDAYHLAWERSRERLGCS